jgi:hypothetical protein
VPFAGAELLERIVDGLDSLIPADKPCVSGFKPVFTTSQIILIEPLPLVMNRADISMKTIALSHSGAKMRVFTKHD